LCQVLHDEVSTLQLEISQIEERNTILTKDNAKLLQRWLDAKQAEVNKMNEENEFYQDRMQSRHQAVLNWRDRDGGGSEVGGNGTGLDSSVSSMSGNEELGGQSRQPMKMNGTPSPAGRGVDLTPNG
jgi:autophagy-related protein 16-1